MFILIMSAGYLRPYQNSVELWYINNRLIHSGSFKKFRSESTSDIDNVVMRCLTQKGLDEASSRLVIKTITYFEMSLA